MILTVFMKTIVYKITMEITNNKKLAHYFTYIPGIILAIYFKPRSFYISEDPLKEQLLI